MEQVERASGDIAKWLKSLRLGDEGESIGGELLDPKQVIIPATSHQPPALYAVVAGVSPPWTTVPERLNEMFFLVFHGDRGHLKGTMTARHTNRTCRKLRCRLNRLGEHSLCSLSCPTKTF